MLRSTIWELITGKIHPSVPPSRGTPGARRLWTGSSFLGGKSLRGNVRGNVTWKRCFFLAFGGKICDNIMIHKIFQLQDGDFIDAMKGNKLCCVAISITISRQEKVIYTMSEINNKSGFIFPPIKDYPGRFSTLNTLWKVSHPDLS